MSKKSNRLVRELTKLDECTVLLEDVLKRYRLSSAALAKRIGNGEPLIEAFETMNAPMRRHRELTETLELFEATRHQVRLALFAVALEEDLGLSEVGRHLGISRQLASRLGAEAAELD